MANNLKKIRENLRLTQDQVAERMGASTSHYRKLENGERGLSLFWIESAAKALQVHATQIIEPDTSVPLMGFVGAKQEILPDIEQVPDAGLDEIKLPFHVDEDLIAFEVRGDSMLPRYRDGDRIVVMRNQSRPASAYVGNEVVVMTTDGRRYLKTLRRGAKGYELHSFNATPMPCDGIEWIGSIYAIIPTNISN
jgi:repressor LexA